MRIGWIERVALPGLGLAALDAKIDTGARTSALHVVSARLIPQGKSARAQPERLEVLLAGLGLAKQRHSLEVEVEDWVLVQDTSGRRERRPVIRTALVLGGLTVDIRLGLTDRGDMRYPLLIGRTALPPGTVVDPHARYLVTGDAPAARSPLRRRAGAKI